MPINITIVSKKILPAIFDEVFDYFTHVDSVYSTYKKDSEISMINRGLPEDQWSAEMKQVLVLCEQTKQETNGYFDVRRGSKIDPSGLVKGWAIKNAADLVAQRGYKNFLIEAGGDFQARGKNNTGKPWQVGIRNPFNIAEIIKVVEVTDKGIATSGTYIRGQHIYNPFEPHQKITDIVALTVIGPDIYNADRFATAAFAMGSKAAAFIESLPGYEAYMVDSNKTATLTSGFESYVVQPL